jgi:hypothetical protein
MESVWQTYVKELPIHRTRTSPGAFGRSGTANSWQKAALQRDKVRRKKKNLFIIMRFEV